MQADSPRPGKSRTMRPRDRYARDVLLLAPRPLAPPRSGPSLRAAAVRVCVPVRVRARAEEEAPWAAAPRLRRGAGEAREKVSSARSLGSLCPLGWRRSALGRVRQPPGVCAAAVAAAPPRRDAHKRTPARAGGGGRRGRGRARRRPRLLRAFSLSSRPGPASLRSWSESLEGVRDSCLNNYAGSFSAFSGRPRDQSCAITHSSSVATQIQEAYLFTAAG